MIDYSAVLERAKVRDPVPNWAQCRIVSELEYLAANTRIKELEDVIKCGS
jgi:hypothetical protein